MERDDELLARLQIADDPARLLGCVPALFLRRLTRRYGLFETVGGRYFNHAENVTRLALAERLRRAGLPHRQHASKPTPLAADAAARFRAELLRQAQVVQRAAPEDLRPALAALDLLLVVAGQAGVRELGEDDRQQLLADVRALLASPRGAAIVAQARSLAGVLIALLG